MQKIAERSFASLHSFVTTNGACTDAPQGVFMPSPDDEPSLPRPERYAEARELCGRCAVRSACLKLAARQPYGGIQDRIFGGYHFTNRQVINVCTGEKLPRTGFFKK